MRYRGLIVGLLFTLVSVSCGSRLPDDVLNAIDNGRGQTSGTQVAGNSTDDASASSGSPATGSGAEAASGGSGSSTSSGGGSSSTGGGGSTSTGGGGGGSQAASTCNGLKANAPGVTDKEIKVASIVTDSGPLPGATEGAFRGAASYFAMVNATGGLCGRKVVLLKGDDGLDPAKARSEFLRLEPQVFAFVGSYSVADSGYIDLIKSSGVPYVSLTIDPSGRNLHNVMPRTSADHVSTGPFVWWKKEHPAVKKAALLYADVAGVGANAPGTEAAMKRAGFDRRYTSAASVTSPDYTPEVRQAQDQGIQLFYLFAFEVNMQVRMVRNMRQQNYNPPIKGANIAFNTRFSELLGKDGDGWENNNLYVDFLDPNERKLSPGLGDFLDWNARVFPGAQLDLFPVSGWGRSALFTQAMRKVTGTITQQSLINALYTIHQFDGGGMEVPIDPTTGLGPPCWNMAIHRGGHWVREYPANKLYECNLGESYKFK